MSDELARSIGTLGGYEDEETDIVIDHRGAGLRSGAEPCPASTDLLLRHRDPERETCSARELLDALIVHLVRVDRYDDDRPHQQASLVHRSHIEGTDVIFDLLVALHHRLH